MLATLPEPDLRIVDALQDAALDPSLWRDALERVAHRIGCIGGGVLTQDPVLKTGSALAGFGIDLAHTEQYFRHYAHVNPMLHHAIVPPLGQPLTGAALMPRHAFAMTEFYNDWIRPQGFSDAVGVVVHRDGTQFTWLSAMRPHGVDEWQRADLDALARLAPHVTRALRVAHRLGVLEEHQRALQEALDQVAHATMLIDRRGRLVFANAVAEALLGAQQTLTVAHGRLLACHPAADAALQAALARSLSHRRDEQHGIEDVPLPRAERRPLVLSVMPARGHAAERLDPDLRVAAIVIAVDPEARPWPRLGGFMDAYGLTPAEGKVLDAVVDGDGVDAIADRLGIRRTTVKTHLNRILGKTGTTRQHELIRLVAGSVPPLRS
ncbi:helix-turn-helix transcriptional regulator [Vineibacter terrae]|uniref:helix-turn-helix transcriptional regulator n=1 Tax=Vineibacter terrae TaxID=2586908 RepID=UPI002E34EC8B|nr:LuxR C-terminal-related transcriptional regulator [Vineibacter terrae]HEX2886208.1 LuxR C-terminal-related transcriptional regulator [Vineibacter terrae]